MGDARKRCRGGGVVSGDAYVDGPRHARRMAWWHGAGVPCGGTVGWGEILRVGLCRRGGVDAGGPGMESPRNHRCRLGVYRLLGLWFSVSRILVRAQLGLDRNPALFQRVPRSGPDG